MPKSFIIDLLEMYVLFDYIIVKRQGRLLLKLS